MIVDIKRMAENYVQMVEVHSFSTKKRGRQRLDIHHILTRSLINEQLLI
jgi:hypothetical protein